MQNVQIFLFLSNRTISIEEKECEAEAGTTLLKYHLYRMRERARENDRWRERERDSERERETVRERDSERESMRERE